MEHILNIEENIHRLEEIFNIIKEGNTILFLGAGASVTEKRYLSKEIIEYYEQKIGINLSEPNITKWVDILSELESFSRADLDLFVTNMLQKLSFTQAHKTLASLPWREIITTNYDLLVERAYDELLKESKSQYDLKIVRSHKEYTYRASNSEIKYVKLNGCISDKGTYPLAFSSNDFNKLKSYYKSVLNELRNLSPKINFISIGYSYQDDFGRFLLDKFDQYNYRDKKWIYNVDPFPNTNTLPYFKNNRICVIKCSFEEFFKRYTIWDNGKADNLADYKNLSISDNRKNNVPLPSKLLLNLENVLSRLDSTRREKHITDEDFYRGEEPNLSLINRNSDVPRLKQLMRFKSSILGNGTHSSHFVPIYFITGEFGIGKSTFTLRLIHELEQERGIEFISFKIEDFTKLRKEYILELIKHCKNKTLVLYCEYIEIESYFKSLLDFQLQLSVEQLQEERIIFIVPIRENILAKFKLIRKLNNIIELNLNGNFEDDEILELINKLNSCNLITINDAQERKNLFNKIKMDYNSDSFVTLMSIITRGNHEKYLLQSYSELSKETKIAFEYTALLHKYNLLMPASLLKNIVALDWDKFENRVIRAEGKGILIQESRNSKGTDPDLYFRTKHPIIAHKLVNIIIPNLDTQFDMYNDMILKINVGLANSYFANDLLKSLSKSGDFNSSQINKLYDSAYTKLSDEPYYLLNYATNLQYRQTVKALEKALSILIYAESLLQYRNHRFIHRRAVINFELAKLFVAREESSIRAEINLRDAKELFEVKQLMDPFSSFSYKDFIELLIWELDNYEFREEEKIRYYIKIEELFDVAYKTVTDNLNFIDILKNKFAEFLGEELNGAIFKEYIDSLYTDFRLKPYACILLYNYHLNHNEIEKCDYYISELETMEHIDEVVKFLFKVYGRNLHIPQNRGKFYRLIRNNSNLEKSQPLRFNFYHFIAESYNFNFQKGRQYLFDIKQKYNILNPEFNLDWLNEDGTLMETNARFISQKNQNYCEVKVLPWQKKIRLKPANYSSYESGEEVQVSLHFYLFGLQAEIVDKP